MMMLMDIKLQLAVFIASSFLLRGIMKSVLGYVIGGICMLTGSIYVFFQVYSTGDVKANPIITVIVITGLMLVLATMYKRRFIDTNE